MDLSHLNETTKCKILDLLVEYSSVFVHTDERVGLFKGVKFPIPTQPGKVVCRYGYKVPYALREPYEKELQRLLKLGLIVRSNSSWCNPSIFLHKVLPCGRIKAKIAIDARWLNNITEHTVSYQTKRINESIDFLAGKSFLSKFDVASAYNNIEVEPADRHKLAFEGGIHGERYEYTRMPYGVKYAPFFYQMATDACLAGISNCLSYFDDLAIATTTEDDHIETLKSVFQRIKGSGLRLRLDKSSIMPRKLEFLGFEIFEGKIKVSEAKLEAVKNFKPPTNRKHLQSFLGLASWMRAHVKGFSDKARPLHKLTRKGTKWEWTEVEEKAFQELKAALTSPPVILHLPDLSKPMFVTTDSSLYSAGCILSQFDGKIERIIAYASRQLTRSEAKRSTFQRELGAVVWALEHFRMYLLATNTTVRTDHRALLNLKDTGQYCPLVTRMIAKLQQYDVTWQYWPGKTIPSDVISRSHDEPCEDDSPDLKTTVPHSSRVVLPVEGTPPAPHLIKQISAMDNWIGRPETIQAQTADRYQRALFKCIKVSVPFIFFSISLV
ncbi:hypothetical protein ONE63_010770 [Megalurothrips usitatus]|uniref:RNA-directed DNA polymerase n=1 Tax=Megalurothrips usitatus TaxID=439358 RepID=A0AAV7XHM4_9NEOP|nr:hypothetical protein ONE63_010770 [Megalurothrips usitatus]